MELREICSWWVVILNSTRLDIWLLLVLLSLEDARTCVNTKSASNKAPYKESKRRQSWECTMLLDSMQMRRSTFYWGFPLVTSKSSWSLLSGRSRTTSCSIMTDWSQICQVLSVLLLTALQKHPNQSRLNVQMLFRSWSLINWYSTQLMQKWKRKLKVPDLIFGLSTLIKTMCLMLWCCSQAVNHSKYVQELSQLYQRCLHTLLSQKSWCHRSKRILWCPTVWFQGSTTNLSQRELGSQDKHSSKDTSNLISKLNMRVCTVCWDLHNALMRWLLSRQPFTFISSIILNITSS